MMIVVFLATTTFLSCEDQFDQEKELAYKFGEKGGGKGGPKDDVRQGELYGDLVVTEIDNQGVPVLYPLRYRADYQDNIIEGIIDVANPKLSGPFNLTIYVRDDDGYVIMEEKGGNLVPKTELVTITPGPEGFLDSPVCLYDMEGEILETVADYVYPIEMGRLNSIRSPEDVKRARMVEVVRNFGNGTVAQVIKDYCGRLYMIRTDDAILEGWADKPIDSPLENLAVYYELMINGFSKSVTDFGLEFLILDTEQQPFGGFDFKSRLDEAWTEEPTSFRDLLNDNQRQHFVGNLAAACIAAASDKFGSLGIDEIVLVNRFLGIPQAVGNDINKPADNVYSFFPYVEQEVRMMDKTNKQQYSKYRYYIDYSTFSYTREKFEHTKIYLCTIDYDYDSSGNLIVIKTPFTNLSMHRILSGEGVNIQGIETERYNNKNGINTGSYGYACQADDYVQALKAVHDNESYFLWDVGTPTFTEKSFLNRSLSPFIFTVDEEQHGNKPPDKGEDGTTGGGGGGGQKGKNSL